MWQRWVICPTTMARTRDTKPRRVLCEPAQYTLHAYTHITTNRTYTQYTNCQIINRLITYQKDSITHTLVAPRKWPCVLRVKITDINGNSSFLYELIFHFMHAALLIVKRLSERIFVGFV